MRDEPWPSPAVIRSALGVIVVGLGLGSVTVASQDPAVDPQARAAVEQMLAGYTSLNALHVKVKWTARYGGGMSAEEFPLPGPSEFELRVQRPNRLNLSASSKRDGRTWSYRIVSDGATLWFWRSATNTFTQGPTGATLADIDRLLPDDAIGTFDGSTWEADNIMEWETLVRGVEPMGALAGSGLAITLGATTRLGDTPVDVIRMKSPDPGPLVPIVMESDLFLSAANHLIRGYRLTTRGRHPDTGRDFSVTMQAEYDIHDAEPRFRDVDFRFTPPRGAVRK